jgi:hypothetical protein
VNGIHISRLQNSLVIVFRANGLEVTAFGRSAGVAKMAHFECWDKRSRGLRDDPTETKFGLQSLESMPYKMVTIKQDFFGF